MSALGSAISGLQASQQWLDVISNNVSNSQTVAYKAQVVSFSDLISQDLSSASGDDSSAGLGGTNAVQVGLGVTVGSIAYDISQGSIESTGKATDIAISGAGYLTVNQDNSTVYTRAGNLTFDSNGDLVTASGGLVQGWSLQESVNPAAPGPMTVIANTLNTDNDSAIGNIVIPSNMQLAPEATTDNTDPASKTDGVVLAGNLDSYTPENSAVATSGLTPTGADADFTTVSNANQTILTTLTTSANATTTFSAYDSLGTEHTYTVYWVQTANTANGAQASWDYYVFDSTGGVSPSLAAGAAAKAAGTTVPGGFVMAGGDGTGSVNAGITSTWTKAVTFNPDGSLATNGNDGAGVAIAENPTISIAETNGSVTPFTFSMNLGTPNNPGSAAVPASYGQSDGLTGTYGSGTTTNGVYSPKDTIYTKFSSGYSSGVLESLAFNASGQIEGTFSNGQTVAVAQLALTNFSNDEGLVSDGDNNYSASANSGSSRIGTAGTAGFGTIQGGALEESNVSLSTELTNMILAQNMYESNTKVITTQANLFTNLIDAVPAQ
jgi:flagellar hook protein FlgE